MSFSRAILRPRVALLGLVALGAGAILWFTFLSPRAPTASVGPVVDRETLWFGTAQRGSVQVEVKGHGAIAPEHVHWISTAIPGKIEKILLQSGAVVQAKTVVVRLNNPEVRLAALEAERQLRSAEGTLVGLSVTLQNQTLSQEAEVQAQQVQLGGLEQQANAYRALGREGLAPSLEVDEAGRRAKDLEVRLSVEQKRLALISTGAGAQLDAKRNEVEQLREIAALRRRAVDELTVYAGQAGVVVEINFETGQWVTAGATLAKVSRPGRLKAEMRFAEANGEILQKGQLATVATPLGDLIGHLSFIDPSPQGGSVRADISLDELAPPDLRTDTNVTATVQIDRLENVLYLPRPATYQGESSLFLFRAAEDNQSATRVNVQLGRASADAVEIRVGLQEGERVILSNMSPWETAERVRLKLRDSFANNVVLPANAI